MCVAINGSDNSNIRNSNAYISLIAIVEISYITSELYSIRSFGLCSIVSKSVVVNYMIIFCIFNNICGFFTTAKCAYCRWSVSIQQHVYNINIIRFDS